VNDDVITAAPQSERLVLPARITGLISGALDSFAFTFFCLSFSSLTHALGAMWYRVSGGE